MERPSGEDRSNDERERDEGRLKEAARRTRTLQAIVLALVLVGTATIIFVIQNTQSTEIEFLPWSVDIPLAGALLAAIAAGIVVGWLGELARRWRARRARRAR